jgi:hypothetical protein
MVNREIVGLIEEVLIIGTQAAETVVAKSDTGAKRTSIDSRLASVLGLGENSNTVKVRSSNGVERRATHPFTVELRGTHTTYSPPLLTEHRCNTT